MGIDWFQYKITLPNMEVNCIYKLLLYSELSYEFISTDTSIYVTIWKHKGV